EEVQLAVDARLRAVRCEPHCRVVHTGALATLPGGGFQHGANDVNVMLPRKLCDLGKAAPVDGCAELQRAGEIVASVPQFGEDDEVRAAPGGLCRPLTDSVEVVRRLPLAHIHLPDANGQRHSIYACLLEKWAVTGMKLANGRSVCGVTYFPYN